MDSCGIQHSYLINGPDVEFLGEDDWHDSAYNSMVVEGLLNQPQAGAAPYCQHRLRVYPTATFEEIHKTGDPVFYTIVIIAFFGFAVLVFVIYDILVSRRQKKTQFKANRTDEIVEQLFPEHVREKLFREETTTFEKDLDATATANKFVSDGENRSMGDKPIAELFPEATVLFADIAGFTAWSSIREPSHVFILLESIFRAFDEVAPKYGIFKVETVGDCYVAAWWVPYCFSSCLRVCRMPLEESLFVSELVVVSNGFSFFPLRYSGVPQYQKNHALLMAKFSRECMDRFEHVVGGLELELGPDTSDLAMRMGMHSGPVTAGVLRGDRARFQLFGDTVNIAAAIEHTGSRERIQVSEQTAGLLTASGKHDWLTPREDLVEGKGQERLKTFWLQLKSEQAAALGQTMGSNIGDEDKVNTEETEVEHKNGITVVSSGRRDRPSMKSSIANRERRLQRLVDWNCELLAQLLKQVVARRHALNLQSTSGEKLTKMATLIGDGTMVVDEVAEIIDMPDFKACTKSFEPVQLTDSVMTQLHQYVSAIASLYLDNPFHNFEHASHGKIMLSVTDPIWFKSYSSTGSHTLFSDNVGQQTIVTYCCSPGT